MLHSENIFRDEYLFSYLQHLQCFTGSYFQRYKSQHLNLSNHLKRKKYGKAERLENEKTGKIASVSPRSINVCVCLVCKEEQVKILKQLRYGKYLTCSRENLSKQEQQYSCGIFLSTLSALAKESHLHIKRKSKLSFHVIPNAVIL